MSPKNEFHNQYRYVRHPQTTAPLLQSERKQEPYIKEEEEEEDDDEAQRKGVMQVSGGAAPLLGCKAEPGVTEQDKKRAKKRVSPHPEPTVALSQCEKKIDIKEEEDDDPQRKGVVQVVGGAAPLLQSVDQEKTSAPADEYEMMTEGTRRRMLRKDKREGAARDPGAAAVAFKTERAPFYTTTDIALKVEQGIKQEITGTFDNLPWSFRADKFAERCFEFRQCQNFCASEHTPCCFPYVFWSNHLERNVEPEPGDEKPFKSCFQRMTDEEKKLFYEWVKEIREFSAVRHHPVWKKLLYPHLYKSSEAAIEAPVKRKDGAASDNPYGDLESFRKEFAEVDYPKLRVTLELQDEGKGDDDNDDDDPQRGEAKQGVGCSTPLLECKKEPPRPRARHEDKRPKKRSTFSHLTVIIKHA